MKTSKTEKNKINFCEENFPFTSFLFKDEFHKNALVDHPPNVDLTALKISHEIYRLHFKDFCRLVAINYDRRKL